MAMERPIVRPVEPIVPTSRDIEAWRLSAEAVNRLGGVKLGEFNWPWVVLSLIAEWEKHGEQNHQAAIGIVAQMNAENELRRELSKVSVELEGWKDLVAEIHRKMCDPDASNVQAQLGDMQCGHTSEWMPVQLTRMRI
jgi:hypothetical protein